jgi:hypothetical protein
MNDALKDWVNNGGRIIAIENAVAQLAKNDWGLKLKVSDDKKDEKKDKDDYAVLRHYEDRSGCSSQFLYQVLFIKSNWTIHIRLLLVSELLLYLKQDDNVYEFIKEGGWNVGIIKKDAQVAGFVGSKLKEKLKDGLLFGVQDIGRGNVIYLADNPMFGVFGKMGSCCFVMQYF